MKLSLLLLWLRLLILVPIVNAIQVVLYQSAFRMDNEHWRITGNTKLEPAVHQTYTINNEMTHYIMFKDNLINTNYKTLDDNSLWYFESPKITINPLQKAGTIASTTFQPQYPTMLSFTLTSFAGEFGVTNLNTNTHLVAIRNDNKCITFKTPDYYNYDGKTRKFMVPFNNPWLWKKEQTYETITEEEIKDLFIGSFTIEILGDWTKGYEVIGIDNVMIYF